MKQHIVILGAGESGVGTAILAKDRGWTVFVSDRGTIAEHYAQQLHDEGIEFESGQHSEDKIFQADLVMKSPGIPDQVDLVQRLRAKNILVVSEIEFAARYTNSTIIGITGSNGKTSTTTMTYDIMKAAGLNVAVGGNIGHSFAYQVARAPHDIYVLELSSFQLDGIVDFKPHVAVITNITPDHLDRYDYQMDKYVASKFRITMNQSSDDYLIYCADDPVVTDYLKKNGTKAHLLPFAIDREVDEGGQATADEIILKINKIAYKMATNKIGKKGKHVTYNSLAASLASRVMNVRKDFIRQSLEDYRNLEHRMEHVSKLNGVEFINDSKATNVNSTWYALESMTKPVVWIVGGVDKGNDYAPLQSLVGEKVKMIICLGIDNVRIHEAFSKNVDIFFNANTMEQAVQVAKSYADDGDCVLLSPACASFDLFENYEDRGNQFKSCVRSI